MVEVGGRIVLAAVLVAASVAKLASPRSSSAALGTFGIRSPGGRWAAWAALIATELMLAAGVAAGIDLAAYLAAALMAAFGAAMLAAMQRGRSGAPCACFGARSTVGWPAVGRNLVLSFAFLALPLLPEGECDDRRVARARSRGRAARLRRAGDRGARARARGGDAAAAARPRRGARDPRGGAAGRLAHRSDRQLRACARVRAGARGVRLRRLPRVPRARAGDRVARP